MQQFLNDFKHSYSFIYIQINGDLHKKHEIFLHLAYLMYLLLI